MILAQRSANEPTEHNNTIDDSPARHPNIQRNLMTEALLQIICTKKSESLPHTMKKKHFQTHSGFKYEQQNF